MPNKATASPPAPLPSGLTIEARGSYCYEHDTWVCTARHEAKGGTQ